MNNKNNNKIKIDEIILENGYCYICGKNEEVVKIYREPTENWEYDIQLCRGCLNEVNDGLEIKGGKKH